LEFKKGEEISSIVLPLEHGAGATTFQ